MFLKTNMKPCYYFITDFFFSSFNVVVQVATAKAVELCPDRLEVGRTPKSLDNEMERLKFKIATQEECRGDREEVARYLSQSSSLLLPPLFHPYLTLMNFHLSAAFSQRPGSTTRLWRATRTWCNRSNPSKASSGASTKSWTRDSRSTSTCESELLPFHL